MEFLEGWEEEVVEGGQGVLGEVQADEGVGLEAERGELVVVEV